MKKFLLFLLAMLAAFIVSRAQNPHFGTLKGIIKDKEGNGAPFANVAIFRSTQLITGGVANLDGEYQVTPISPGIYDVQVSCIGFTKIIFNNIHIQADSITLLNGTFKHTEPIKVIECFSMSAPTSTTRGSRGDAKIYVDGVKVRGAVGTAQSTAQSVQVVTGGVPANIGDVSGRTRQAQNLNAVPGSDEHTHFEDNPFLASRMEPLSTFSVDVDKASYAMVRNAIKQGIRPPVDAVRVEELINYFDYNYPDPEGEHPFRIITELTQCPWNADSRILKLALQGKRISDTELPPSAFTFLVDVSGSMDQANKLPLVQASLLKLLDKMRPQDKVGIVVYAGAAGVVLEPQTVGRKSEIVSRIMAMQAGGSTAGGQGIQLAYKLAEEHFVKGGNNRIILCTDGDFNVGISSEGDLTDLIEKERQKGIFLTVLGYGMGNYKDNKLELLADKGNGNYAYIDDYAEAEKFLGKEFAGSMYTIAKDVKIQIEFNPDIVKSYRLIGYENRVLATQDFNDDKKDAGEIGAGHTVTALYELRADEKFCKKVDSLKYRKSEPLPDIPGSEMATVKFRYKKPDGDKSILLTQTLQNSSKSLAEADENTRFAIAVAAFGMMLRESPYIKSLSLNEIMELASGAATSDKEGLRKEFMDMLRDYKKLDGSPKG